MDEQTEATNKPKNNVLIIIILVSLTIFFISRSVIKVGDIRKKAAKEKALTQLKELEQITSVRELKKEQLMYVAPGGKFSMAIEFDMLQDLDNSRKEVLFSGISKSYQKDKAGALVRLIHYNESLTLLDNWKLAHEKANNEINSTHHFTATNTLFKNDSTTMFTIDSKDKSLMGVVKLIKRDTLLYEARGQYVASDSVVYAKTLHKMIGSFRLWL